MKGKYRYNLSINSFLLLDLFLLYILGICILHENAFAKIHITLPVVHLPLFLGEMLMIALFIYIAILSFKRRITLPFHYTLFFLLAALFVVLKTNSGFKIFGPLAFRNAAMFYYSFIILIGYFTFHKKFDLKKYLKQRFSILLLLYFLITVILLRYNHGYRINILIITVASSCFLMADNWKYKLFYVIPIVPSLGWFMTNNDCRGSYIAFIGAVIFLFVILAIFCKQRRIDKRRLIKPAITILILMLAFISYTIIFERHRAINIWSEFCSIANLDRIKFVYQQTQDRIQEKLAYKTKEELLKEHDKEYGKFVRLYNPDRHKGKIEETLRSLISSVPKRGTLSKEEVTSRAEEGIIAGTNEEVEMPRKDIELKVKKTEDIAKVRLRVPNYSNMIWRFYIWKDMLQEGLESPILGEPFGKPFRSIPAILWLGYDNAEDVGWIEPHNSFIHMFYRGGIIGIIYFFTIFIYLFFSVFRLPKEKIFLIPIHFYLVYMFLLALTNVAFELPYHAIPFWFFAGIYLNLLESKNEN